LAPLAPSSPSIFSTVLPNYAARLAGLNLPLELEEAPIGAVETLRQDRCNVKEGDRVYPKYGGRIGDVKQRGFQRMYRGMGMFGPPFRCVASRVGP
jgi:hypothetical protein